MRLTIPRLPIAPHCRHARTARRPRLDIEVDSAIATILEIITRAPAPVISVRVTSVDNLDRDRAPRADAVVVGVEATGGELVALPARGTAIGLAAAVELTFEELLVDGAIVDARAAAPLPGGLAAVAGGAHPAVVLWVERSAFGGNQAASLS